MTIIIFCFVLFVCPSRSRCVDDTINACYTCKHLRCMLIRSHKIQFICWNTHSSDNLTSVCWIVFCCFQKNKREAKKTHTHFFHRLLRRNRSYSFQSAFWFSNFSVSRSSDFAAAMWVFFICIRVGSFMRIVKKCFWIQRNASFFKWPFILLDWMQAI